MVKSLQHKLDEAVSKISELTDVLSHLNPEYTTEAYWEKSAQQAMEPMLAKAGQHQQSSVSAAAIKPADGNQSRISVGKSDYLTSSHVTVRRN